MAPQLQKYVILPKVFWPKALHGASNCIFSESYTHTLRKTAVKALCANGAGSNSLLRLSLSGDLMNDPGYYDLCVCIRAFRRMLRKCPDLLPLWRLRHEGFDGKLIPGPFSRLFQCLSMIGWSILDPPLVMDHEQRCFDIQLIDHKTLTMALEDARAHWLQCPRFAHLRTGIGGWHDDIVTLPACTLNHLIVPRSELALAWRSALWHLEDRANFFSLVTPPPGLNHVFVDGSCTCPDHDPLQLASYAVLNASSGEPLASAPLHGLAQCIDRAELAAMLVAFRWAFFHGTDACVWSDSLSTAKMRNHLLQGGALPEDVANRDLWLLLQMELAQIGSLDLRVRWNHQLVRFISSRLERRSTRIFTYPNIDEEGNVTAAKLPEGSEQELYAYLESIGPRDVSRDAQDGSAAKSEFWRSPYT
eukprot:Skav235632  [mRNA]  locus=scaffold358:410684:420403:- [translate_table: standard]